MTLKIYDLSYIQCINLNKIHLIIILIILINNKDFLEYFILFYKLK